MGRYPLLFFPFLFLIPSAVIDYKTGRIPNVITFPAIIIGLGLCLFFCSGSFYAQCCTAVILLFLVSGIGVAGMGDMKLMMAVAAVSGFFLTALTIAIAMIILILHSLFVDRTATIQAARTVMSAIGTGDLKLMQSEGKKWPLAPYLLTGYTLALIWRLLS